MRQVWIRRSRALGVGVLGFLCAFFCSPAADAAEPGTAGFLSLRLGTGARFSGMGDVGVSLARDASAAYWNPAGMTSVERTSFTLQHNEWIQSVRAETAALAHATNLGVFGIWFSGLYMDEIERTTIASSTPEGTFNVYEIAVQGAWGHTLGTVERLGGIDLGLAIKGLYSALDSETASGWAGDIGLRLRTRIDGLTFAAAAQHLGPEMTFIQDSFQLPVTLRVGGDYQRSFAKYRTGFVLAYDLEVVNDDGLRNHFGLELTYHELLSIRGGLKIGFDSQGAELGRIDGERVGGTFGVGVRKGGYSFDYAYTPVDNDLGDAHRFSLTINL
ncbi:MAG: PorV/PorQ family protein [Candidatus Latescibacterota bacterium]|nr:MAG: PorV/PorQ family protein [Candidatus Latescibacterota bacterium]